MGIPEALRVEIDEPASRSIDKPVTAIRGWCASGDDEISGELQFRIGGKTVPHRPVARPDTEAAMPEHAVAGFLIRLDLSFYLEYIQGDCLLMHLVLPGHDPHPLRFTIKKGVVGMCLAAAGGV